MGDERRAVIRRTRRVGGARRVPLGVSQIRIEERRQRVWRARATGATYEAIAKAEGVTTKTVRADIDAVMATLQRDVRADAEQWRHAMLTNLRELHQAYYGRAVRGDYASLDRIMRIADRIADLLGVDVAPAAAPTMTEYVVDVIMPAPDVIDITPTTAPPDVALLPER